MSRYTPDSWIERRDDCGLTTDDAGYCEICGYHLDSGRCPGHCEDDTCGHVSHCDACDRGLNYTPDIGVCFVCEAEWLASHALTYTPPIARSVMAFQETHDKIMRRFFDL